MGGKKDFFLSSAEMEITRPEADVFIMAEWLKTFKQNIMEKMWPPASIPPPKSYRGGGSHPKLP